MAKCPLHCARNNPISWLDDLQTSKLSNGSRGKYGTFWNLEFQAERKEDVIFFRPTPDGSCQIIYQAGKTIALCKFTELMQ
jgi:hypothetical protein